MTQFQCSCCFLANRPISDQTQNVKLGVFHRNLLGLDEFVGEVCIPLQELQIYARPTSRYVKYVSRCYYC